jgi:hypothetical protein
MIEAEHPAESGSARYYRGSSATDMQAAEEPNNEKNNRYQAQSAAGSRPTISTVFFSYQN